jgi:hypothetical protein
MSISLQRTINICIIFQPWSLYQHTYNISALEFQVSINIHIIFQPWSLYQHTYNISALEFQVSINIRIIFQPWSSKFRTVIRTPSLPTSSTPLGWTRPKWTVPPEFRTSKYSGFYFTVTKYNVPMCMLLEDKYFYNKQSLPHF